MNPPLNVLRSPPAGTTPGVIDAADVPNGDSSTFARLLGQFTSTSTIATAESGDQTDGKQSLRGAVTNSDPALVAPTTIAPEDAIVPDMAERDPGVSVSDANLVTGLLEHMLAAATMQPSPQPPAPIVNANSAFAETAPSHNPAVARAIAMPMSENHDADAQLTKTAAIPASATPLAAGTAGMETESNTPIPMPMPMPQVLDAASTRSSAHLANAAGAMPDGPDMTQVSSMNAHTSGASAPSNLLPPDVMQVPSNAGGTAQAQAALLELATPDHGASTHGSATARDFALSGAPQSLSDLVRQAPIRDDGLAVAQGLAQPDHALAPGSTAGLAPGRAPQPLAIDETSSDVASSSASETLAGMRAAGMPRGTSNTRASGYADPRERSDEFVIPASAAVASPMRGDPVTTLSIAPRMDTPEWQPAFARSVKMLVSDGTPAASLQLNPAEFGPIEVRIVINDRRADISFLVTNPNADAALQSALPELRDQLARSGIQLGQTSVGTQAQDHRQPADTPRREPAANPTNAPAAGPVLPSRPRSTSQIDTFA